MAPTAGTRLRMKHANKKKNKSKKKIPSLKNRIRALERFLKRPGIDREMKKIKQKELTQLQKQQEDKEQVEEMKQNVEKYKKPRFFERVKLMRKLKKVKNQMDQATTNSKEKEQYKNQYEQIENDLKYVYYYPKTEPYLSLFPSKPFDEKNQKRQEELKEMALKKFKQEKPLEAFHTFCFVSTNITITGSSTSNPSLEKLQKRTPKYLEKKKKIRKEKTSKIKKTGAFADEEDEDHYQDEVATIANEDENDDFFLSH